MTKNERRIAKALYNLLWFAALGIPGKLAAQDAKPADYSKEPFILERISTKAAFENDGKYTVDSLVRLRIQSQAALLAFGMVRFPYASATSTMEIVHVIVIKPDKRVVETPAENALDMPSEITRQAPFYSDLKEKQLAVKGLEIGDTLEAESHQVVTKPLDPGQFWLAFNFTESGVVLEEQLQVSTPRDRYVKVKSQKVQPIVTEQGAYRIYTWKTSHLTREEPKATESDEPKFPAVQLTTFHSWDEVGEWFQGLIAPRAVPSPEIQAKAKELTLNSKTDTEKTEAIYNYVSTKYRYIGISLGIGRYQPQAAAEVLSNDYGDCKDKHTLFAALLAAVGVKAYPALINSEVKIDPEVPSPGQFDHMITALPQGKGYLFLDTTPEVAPYGFLLANLRDKKALVIPVSGPTELVQTPIDPPSESYFNFQADGTLDAQGTLETKMQMTFRGDAEIIYRTALRQAGQPQWKDVMQRISSNLGYGGTVSDVTTSPTDATDIPFHIEYKYNRKEYSDWANKQIGPPFPPVFIPPPPDESDTPPKPIKLGTPSGTTYQATIKLPATASPKLPPAVDIHESFADYHAVYSFSDGTLRAERRLLIRAREIEPGQIAAYRKFQKAIEEDVSTYIPVFANIVIPGESAENPESQALFEKGAQAWRDHKMPEALDYYQRSVEKDPKFAEGWFQLGSAHYFMGDVDEGFADWKKSAVLDPSRSQELKFAATTMMNRKHDTDALELWRAMEKAHPDDIDVPRNIALLLSQEGHTAEAVTELEAAIKLKPDDNLLRVQLAHTYIQARENSKAIATLKEIGDKNLHDPWMLNNVAYELGDNNLDMENSLHYGQMAVEQIENKSDKISLDSLTLDDIQLMPNLPADWDTLGWIYFKMGRLDLAEKYLYAAWRLGQDPIIGDHLGQVYEKQGKKHEAAVAYSNALAAGHAPEETRARLEALSPGGKHQPSDHVNGSALQEDRSLKLGKFPGKPAKHASAEFFVLFTNGPKVTGVKFISGSEELREAGSVLAAAKWDVPFPSDHPTQILRRGILDCEPEIAGCMMALIPVTSVHSVK